MSNLYRTLRAGGKLDAEINRKLFVPGRTALQWTSTEIKTNFLDKVATDETNSLNLRTIATNLGNKLLAIATDRAGKKGTAKFKNILSLDVNATATQSNLAAFTPLDQTFQFPNANIEAPTDIVFYGGGIFDILGYVISCLGPLNADVRQAAALKTAKETFLLPLAVLYAKWCVTIAAECGVIAQSPSCVELAVRVSSWTTVYFALGASVAGFDGGGALLKSTIVQNRRNMLVNKQFLTQADLPSPPARILTLLEVPGATVNVPPTGGGAAQPANIWKQSVLEVWKKQQAATVSKPYNPTNAEKPILQQMKAWADLAAAARADAPATLAFAGDAAELKSFAERWLNPDVYKSWDSGREFGNCGETYPLVMLKSLDRLQEKMPSDANIVYGGIAVLTDKIKSTSLIAITDNDPTPPPVVVGGALDARYLKPNSVFSACANCRVLMKSTAVAGATSPLMFLTASARPFTVRLDNIIQKQWAV